MRWNPARQIERIEYQCLAIGFLAAGQRIFAVRPPKSTARQFRKKSRFFNNGGSVSPLIGGSEWLLVPAQISGGGIVLDRKYSWSCFSEQASNRCWTWVASILKELSQFKFGGRLRNGL
jgi:hypothetical protein